MLLLKRRGGEIMRTVFALLFALLVAIAAPARAQDYPVRPVKIVIAFPVGGLLDTISRIVGEKLSSLLGQQFVIEARPGAGGTLATAAVARAEPDGYTLMMINDNHSLNPSVFKNIPYDSIKDFAAVGFVGSAPLVFTVNAGLSPRTVKEVV
jgi:tripartite-type tricarboxylate transporter receptor subunit TctC